MNGLSMDEVVKLKWRATGIKRYVPVFRFNGKRRYSRLMFKRAWEAEAYGKRLAVRGLRGIGCNGEKLAEREQPVGSLGAG